MMGHPHLRRDGAVGGRTAFVGALLVLAHQAQVSRHISGKDRGETAFDRLVHGLSTTPIIAEP
jgi:hypothetical protein